MDIILVPGFWLDGSSWAAVAPELVQAGHTVHPLTLPGMESADADRSGIGLQDHIDAVVRAIDGLAGKVVLVGHSGGGAIIYGAIDARPDRVARGIYVDSGPLAEGGVINDELPVVDGEVPLPEWGFFEDADLTGLTEGLRARFRAQAISEPEHVASDAMQLHDDARLAVPATVICCEFTADQLRQWVASGDPHVSELGAIVDVEYVDLPTGHWPQFTRPTELGQAILRAVDRG